MLTCWLLRLLCPQSHMPVWRRGQYELAPHEWSPHSVTENEWLFLLLCFALLLGNVWLSPWKIWFIRGRGRCRCCPPIFPPTYTNDAPAPSQTYHPVDDPAVHPVALLNSSVFQFLLCSAAIQRHCSVYTHLFITICHAYGTFFTGVVSPNSFQLCITAVTKIFGGGRVEFWGELHTASTSVVFPILSKPVVPCWNYFKEF